MIALYIWIFSLLPLVCGNTEKVIFLGPPPVDVLSTYPGLDHLELGRLSPENVTIRTHLKAEFPDHGSGSGRGKPAWFVLHNLMEGQRYEVRLCWAATQPTSFRLEAYELDTVFKAPNLKTDLSEYASTLQSNIGNHVAISPQALKDHREDSVMLLRILAAADFYTTNHTLMENVPPVYVDIILDPFISNILPKSLLPTIAYITVVVVVSWFAGKRISSWIRQIAAQPAKYEKKYQ
ncbi:hypothetical protein GGR50DRAFT_38990 [Xylaria sp. CBS 124048]|nr:hypothetical protein GGR50DRAFT_38990 [Xylaria sp. CBS 124048]